MTHDENLYQDFGTEPTAPGPTTGVEVHDAQAGRDLLIAQRDNNITNYFAGLAHLRPRPVDRSRLLPNDLIVTPSSADTGLAPMPFPVGDPLGRSVYALIGPEASGRRTIALNLLDERLEKDLRIFELLPDWDEPDVARIPCEPHTGYLLNLTDVAEPLGSTFHEQLADYAMRAYDSKTRLVIIASEHVWGTAPEAGPGAPVMMWPITRPPALEITRKLILAQPEERHRAAWLQVGTGVFADLLCGDEPPADAVRLAHIILQAAGPDDLAGRDGFLGWQGQLQQWFGSTDPKAPEKRALQIAAAFLDGCRARTVLDAADALLAMNELNWPVRVGGPLAGADDTQRCAAADVAFTDDGMASISKARPGIDLALLRHVWNKRPQLVPVLTRWLSEISRPSGVADGELVRLAEVLTAIAEWEGPEAVLALIRQWLSSGKQRADLAVDLLGRLAVDPVVGARVRKELTGWAKAPKYPERQQAVVAVCQGRLGNEYSSIALTRLKYVLDEATDSEVRTSAIDALRAMLLSDGLAARVLKTIVEWAESQNARPGSRSAFLTMFAGTGLASADALLTAEGPEGDAVRRLLRNGWRTLWRNPDLRASAADTLGGWCAAADAGGLPADAVEEITAVVFEEAACDALGDDLDKVIGGNSELRKRLRARYVDVVRETAARRGTTHTEQVA